MTNQRSVLDHVVGVGGGAAGDEPAERAVDQRRVVCPEVRDRVQTLEAALKRPRQPEREREREGESEGVRGFVQWRRPAGRMKLSAESEPQR